MATYERYTMFATWGDMIDELAEDHGKELVADLVLAMNHFAFKGEEPDFPKGSVLKLLWKTMYKNIESSGKAAKSGAEGYAKKVAKGKPKGAAKTPIKTPSKGAAKDPSDTTHGKDSFMDKEMDMDMDVDKEMDRDGGKTSVGFPPIPNAASVGEDEGKEPSPPSLVCRKCNKQVDDCGDGNYWCPGCMTMTRNPATSMPSNGTPPPAEVVERMRGLQQRRSS